MALVCDRLFPFDRDIFESKEVVVIYGVSNATVGGGGGGGEIITSPPRCSATPHNFFFRFASMIMKTKPQRNFYAKRLLGHGIPIPEIKTYNELAFRLRLQHVIATLLIQL